MWKSVYVQQGCGNGQALFVQINRCENTGAVHVSLSYLGIKAQGNK